MPHATDLQISMYVDDALLPSEQSVLAAHCDSCSVCQARIAHFITEKSLINSALELPDKVPVPAFQQPVQIKGLAMHAVIITFVSGFFITLGKSLYNAQMLELFSWLTPFHIPNGFRLTVNSVFYFSKEGTTMIDSFLKLAVFGLLLTALAWLVVLQKKSPRKIGYALSFSMLMIITGSLLSPSPANALEFRQGEAIITVEDSEVIQDTLIIAGENLVINGIVEGDLVAFGRTLIINGEIKGNLIAFSETTSMKGKVHGSVMGFSNNLELFDAEIASNLFGFSNLLSMNENSEIGGNATIFNNTASLSGKINRDLSSFNQNMVLRATVGEDVDVFAQNMDLKEESYINGNLHLRTNNKDNFEQAPGATVLGDIEITIDPKHVQHGKQYLHFAFYLFLLVKMAAAFIFGIILLWLLPKLRTLSLGTGRDNLKTAGIGLLTLIASPIILLLLALTVVGIPISIIGLLCYGITVYFGKILLASIVGRMIITSPEKKDNIALTLLAGLVLFTLITNIPWIGGIFSFIFSIIGIGLIVQQVLIHTSNQQTHT